MGALVITFIVFSVLYVWLGRVVRNQERRDHREIRDYFNAIRREQGFPEKPYDEEDL